MIKGYCIISMVTGHLAAGSITANVLHIFPKFDGASGFVLLSGLVLGIIQSRKVTNAGAFREIITHTLKRARMVYIAQIFLSVAGVAAFLAFGWAPTTFPPNLQEMSPTTIVVGIMTMNIAPPGGDVLRLYVVFLLMATAVYALLTRGQWLLTLFISAGIAGVGYAFPHETSFSLLGGAPSASWAGWQLLFVSAIVLGWSWRHLAIPQWIRAHQWQVLLSGVAMTVIAAVASLMPVDEEWLFSKYLFPPGRIFVAYAVVAALYVVATWLLRALPDGLLRPVWLIGQRSLDSYIIQAFAGVLVLGVLLLSPTSWVAQASAILVLVVCWAWAALRARFQFTLSLTSLFPILLDDDHRDLNS